MSRHATILFIGLEGEQSLSFFNFVRTGFSVLCLLSAWDHFVMSLSQHLQLFVSASFLDKWFFGAQAQKICLSKKDHWCSMEGAPQEPKGNRDWRRTISLDRDFDGNRREGWCEEERENNSLGPRRDRWKEGERERAVEQISSPLQNRRGINERRAENNMAAGREPGEPLRRAPADRWADTNSREANFDNRRDSKWSTRWGPEDKERELRGPRDVHDKEVVDTGGYHQRHVTTNSSGRDYERDRDRDMRELDSGARGDRAWRSHSLASRGRGEGPPLGATPPKMAPGFGIGRGRGDPTGLGFSVGRGRANFSGILQGPPLSSPIGASSLLDKWNGGGDDNNAFQYSRAKLLDIYRKVGALSSFAKYPDGFIEVQLLTQSKVSEPLAFITPDMEEEVRSCVILLERS